MESTALTHKTFGQIIGQHIATVGYLIGAELRFKMYCSRLYVAKRPYLISTYGMSMVAFAAMYGLAILAQVV